jgi:hypothetical protein
MKTMDYIFADYLTPDQLMEGDLIKISDEYGDQIVEVVNVHAIDEGYLIETKNDFDEEVDVPALDDTRFAWYVISEE